jgi:hypothetical protein
VKVLNGHIICLQFFLKECAFFAFITAVSGLRTFLTAKEMQFLKASTKDLEQVTNPAPFDGPELNPSLHTIVAHVN